MRRSIDMIGLRFGRLLVIEQLYSKRSGVQWLCRCDCGSLTKVAGSNLRNGHTQSCGCLRKTLLKDRAMVQFHKRCPSCGGDLTYHPTVSLTVDMFERERLETA